MKRCFLVSVCILAIAGCGTQQPGPSATATGAITPTSYAAGSATNTTTAFDGTWIGGPVSNMSAGSALLAGEKASQAPQLRRPEFDYLQRPRTA
jgi:hypothetical protein